ncbi:MAG: hypothetical protein ACKOOL_11665 [Novosphingobium sp.]
MAEQLHSAVAAVIDPESHGIPDPGRIVELLKGLRRYGTAETTAEGEAEEGDGGSAIRQQIELSVIETLVLASEHMHDMGYRQLNGSMALRGPEDTPSKLRIAMINRKRNDVPHPNFSPSARRKYPFAWDRTQLTAGLAPNTETDEGFAYDEAVWVTELLDSLRAALKQGANFICFGEYDYPPQMADEGTFKDRVKAILNGVAQQSLVVLGSAHEFESGLNGTTEVNDVPYQEVRVENVARLFFSDSLLNAYQARKPLVNPYVIRKRTPAWRVGERLSSPKDPKLYGFNTPFGRLAVLVCSDAYDPTIAMKVAKMAAKPEDKPDFIVVPAYNASKYFPAMCQLISLLTRSTVILVDACRVGDTYPYGWSKSQIWVCGMPAGEVADEGWPGPVVCNHLESLPIGAAELEIWEFDLVGYHAIVSEIGRLNPTPSFSRALKKVALNRSEK